MPGVLFEAQLTEDGQVGVAHFDAVLGEGFDELFLADFEDFEPGFGFLDVVGEHVAKEHSRSGGLHAVHLESNKGIEAALEDLEQGNAIFFLVAFAEFDFAIVKGDPHFVSGYSDAIGVIHFQVVHEAVGAGISQVRQGLEHIPHRQVSKILHHVHLPL